MDEPGVVRPVKENRVCDCLLHGLKLWGGVLVHMFSNIILVGGKKNQVDSYVSGH